MNSQTSALSLRLVPRRRLFRWKETVAAVVFLGGFTAAVSALVHHATEVGQAHSALLASYSEETAIVAMVTRDLAYLDPTGGPICAAGSCKMLLSTGETVTYTAGCVPSPALLASQPFAAAIGCQAAAACPLGQRPILTLTRPGGEATQTFPLWQPTSNALAATKPLGASACFQVGANGDLRMDVSYYYFDVSKTMQTLHRGVVLPTVNMAEIKLNK